MLQLGRVELKDLGAIARSALRQNLRTLHSRNSLH
jgi:hypothetical protein